MKIIDHRGLANPVEYEMDFISRSVTFDGNILYIQNINYPAAKYNWDSICAGGKVMYKNWKENIIRKWNLGGYCGKYTYYLINRHD